MVQCCNTIEMMKEVLQKIIGKKVIRFLLVVWPPFGEDENSQIDISAGYVFEDAPKELFIISTDKNDLTTPTIEIRSIPNSCFDWSEFKCRMQDWMNCVEGMEIDTEFYEIYDEDIFKNIVNQEVTRVELLEITEDDLIGIKVFFEYDYVLSTPITDGNTIETSLFNKINNISNLAALGEITYKNVSEE